VLFLGTFPWWYYAGKGAVQTIKTAQKSMGPLYDEESAKSLFLVLWFFIPLAVFVLARSKLPLYVLPLFVPLAVVTAREIERLNVSLDKWRYLIALWCVFLVLVRLITASLNFKQDASKIAENTKKQYPHPVVEIIFVNVVPAFGLQFYTGSDIERVSLEPSDLKRQFAEHKSRLWYVPDYESKGFREAIASLGVNMQEVGIVSAREDYIIFREIDDKMQQ
jgi:hypothetical protein